MSSSEQIVRVPTSEEVVQALLAQRFEGAAAAPAARRT